MEIVLMGWRGVCVSVCATAENVIQCDSFFCNRGMAHWHRRISYIKLPLILVYIHHVCIWDFADGKKNMEHHYVFLPWNRLIISLLILWGWKISSSEFLSPAQSSLVASPAWNLIPFSDRWAVSPRDGVSFSRAHSHLNLHVLLNTLLNHVCLLRLWSC